ncbi:MAG: helix-turn-helix domain-containing protein [Clostridia bacterium]|nr:helix-turn-helix domain-containing protein [Clostridia bacterium]
MIRLGEKIKSLRKERNLSQEVLAGYLGVSFQAVSKWENDTTMPDVTMIPAIASFFGVSTDELFDFNLYETEKKVTKICDEALCYRYTDRVKSEQILRQGLQRFPGNDMILNNLLYTLDEKNRADEVIALCRSLIESTKDDSVKYDACRILAKCYKENGMDDLIEPVLEMLPEIYFTKLELAASLLQGEDRYQAAQLQKNLSAESLVDMLMILGKHWLERGERDRAAVQFRIAQRVIDAFEGDELEPSLFKGTVCESLSDRRAELAALLSE